MTDGSATSAVAEQETGADNDTMARVTTYRTTKWPTDPPPKVGEPIVEFVTRHELRASGWSPQLIRKYVGKPHGTRRVGRPGRSKLVYLYRLDRVRRAEQDDGFAAAFAKVRRGRVARGTLPLVSPPTDPRPLAMDVYQLKARGWSNGLIGRFMTNPDGFDLRGDRNYRLYAVTRVEQVEATPEFQEELERHLKWEAERRARWEAEEAVRKAAWEAEWQAQRERERTLRREGEERTRRKRESLAAAFPGFTVSARVFNRGWGGEVAINDMTAVVAGPEFCRLVREGEETGRWSPLVTWLLGQDGVGLPGFRAALRFLAAGDPDGWGAWREPAQKAA